MYSKNLLSWSILLVAAVFCRAAETNDVLPSARRTPVVTDCGYPSSTVLSNGRVLTVYFAVGSKQHPEWGVHCGAVVFAPPATP